MLIGRQSPKKACCRNSVSSRISREDTYAVRRDQPVDPRRCNSNANGKSRTKPAFCTKIRGLYTLRQCPDIAHCLSIPRFNAHTRSNSRRINPVQFVERRPGINFATSAR
jgi:hypothetical protein